ncbi:MAG: glycosyltransferase, partial [Vicinamibacteria bacterium]
AARPPLAGRVEVRGYVAEAERRALLASAAVLVLPSFDEGFGIPALEAMACGVPVVASNRGALPEVVGDAEPLVDPDDIEGLALAVERLLDPAEAETASARGFARAARFSWDAAARSAYAAFTAAVARRGERG